MSKVQKCKGSLISWVLNRNPRKLFRSSESGRSMVEILGVLAIMGVLSVGGILGYGYAVEVHRENQTLDMISKTAAGAVTGFSEKIFLGTEEEDNAFFAVPMDQVTSGYEIYEDAGIEYILSPQETDISVYASSRSVEVDVGNITYNVCRRTLQKTNEYQSAYIKGTAEIVYPDDTVEDKDDFCKRVDALERSPGNPHRDATAEEKENANMTLCYSEIEGACGEPDADCDEGDRSGCLSCNADGEWEIFSGWQSEWLSSHSGVSASCITCNASTGSVYYPTGPKEVDVYHKVGTTCTPTGEKRCCSTDAVAYCMEKGCVDDLDKCCSACTQNSDCTGSCSKCNSGTCEDVALITVHKLNSSNMCVEEECCPLEASCTTDAICQDCIGDPCSCDTSKLVTVTKCDGTTESCCSLTQTCEDESPCADDNDDDDDDDDDDCTDPTYAAENPCECAPNTCACSTYEAAHPCECDPSKLVTITKCDGTTESCCSLTQTCADESPCNCVNNGDCKGSCEACESGVCVNKSTTITKCDKSTESCCPLFQSCTDEVCSESDSCESNGDCTGSCVACENGICVDKSSAKTMCDGTSEECCPLTESCEKESPCSCENNEDCTGTCEGCENGECVDWTTSKTMCDGTTESCCPLTENCTDESPCECTEECWCGCMQQHLDNDPNNECTCASCADTYCCTSESGKIQEPSNGCCENKDDCSGSCMSCENGECVDNSVTITKCDGTTEECCPSDTVTCEDESPCPCDCSVDEHCYERIAVMECGGSGQWDGYICCDICNEDCEWDCHSDGYPSNPAGAC